jgi:hypothetical protein
MKLAALLFLAALAVAHAESGPLIHLDSKVYGDASFDVRVDEVAREGNVSRLHVVPRQGGPTATSLFVTEAMYRIAKARGAACFIPLRKTEAKDGSWDFLVGFSDDKDADLHALFGPAGDEAAAHHAAFLSVAQFALLFDRKPLAPMANAAEKDVSGKKP